MRIRKWLDIAVQYSETIILGNGASMAFCPESFQYKSLFQQAISLKHINKSLREIFEKVAPRNCDFERVLYQLWMADFVNAKLGIPDNHRKTVRNEYLRVRNALIKTVKDVHPTQSEIAAGLVRAGEFIKRFKTVFYLNYDLIMYWALMTVNSSAKNRVKDGFNRSVHASHNQKNRLLEFTTDLSQLWEPFGINTQSTAVFFPHGSLMLYRTRAMNSERKLGAGGSSDILKAITDTWRENGNSPIFVCEGDSTTKLESIAKSKYLTMVYQDILPQACTNIVIYGWGMGQQDTHILKQLMRSKPKRVAVSVYCHGRSKNSVKQEMDKIRERLRHFESIKRIDFFDASSSGCWLHE